jgi:hypothetical protein
VMFFRHAFIGMFLVLQNLIFFKHTHFIVVFTLKLFCKFNPFFPPKDLHVISLLSSSDFCV